METCIYTKNLCKNFIVNKKESGLKGSLKALMKPEHRSIEAVRNVNFHVKKGEMLGFIGPNGSGKSTTIKMLIGLLYPSSGEVNILGLNPWEQRRKLSYNIGTVFGQKSQLWYHIPPKDTFELLAKIYELDKNEFKKQKDMLVELFDLSKLLDIPVRKLSLGQRVKCEIAASLLHKPKLIFLDEPTIGLDVLAKQQIRSALKEMNSELGSTIFITSHDAEDVESLCNRVIVVNEGTIAFDDNISTLKKCFLTYKDIEISFSTPIEDNFKLDEIEFKKINANSIQIRTSTKDESAARIIKQIMASRSIADITIKEQSLEDVIRNIYISQFPNKEDRMP